MFASFWNGLLLGYVFLSQESDTIAAMPTDHRPIRGLPKYNGGKDSCFCDFYVKRFLLGRVRVGVEVKVKYLKTQEEEFRAAPNIQHETTVSPALDRSKVTIPRLRYGRPRNLSSISTNRPQQHSRRTPEAQQLMASSAHTGWHLADWTVNRKLDIYYRVVLFMTDLLGIVLGAHLRTCTCSVYLS
jgi:hypothetical protein